MEDTFRQSINLSDVEDAAKLAPPGPPEYIGNRLWSRSKMLNALALKMSGSGQPWSGFDLVARSCN